MAGVIKRQILKHLSRFTKNLSPEQINLSTLRGEGQLTDLQLDEEVLQNMLDLPTWLAVTRVYCNQAAIRIQWTKLKTQPIRLMIDKVEVEMKTCMEPRPPNGPSPIALATGQSEYGFAEKVVEGMFLDVGCICIKIESSTFQASVQLWQLQSYSVCPNWQKSDLRYTRLTHPQRAEVLTFKQVTWQTLRVEAYASETCEDTPSTPLRLLTNSGHLRIALKRRIKDCLVLSSELSFFLDDLLWVLTNSQLEAFFSYANSLNEAIKKSMREKKEVPSSSSIASPCSDSSTPSTSSGRCELFERFDVKETSYHLLISRLDLHLCSDSEALGTIPGDAIKLTLQRIALDFYPSHRTGQSCTHWRYASSAMETCEQWIQDLSEERKNSEEHIFCPHEKSGYLEQGQSNKNLPSTSIYFRSMLVRIDKVDIHQVSTPGQTQPKPPLLSCVHIPASCSAIHLQYTEFYCLSGKNLTVPSPALYIQLYGLVISLTAPTILWLNLFILDLSHHLQTFGHLADSADRAGAIENRDVRLDGFNIKVILPVQPPPCSPPERPSSVSAHISRITLSNTRQAPGSTLDYLQQAFRLFAANPVFHYPPGPLHPVFISHVYPSSFSPSSSLWSLHSSGLSVSFGELGVKHQEFLHRISFTAWACLLQPQHHLQVILNIEDSVRVQLNHYQYLTLLRSQEQLQNLLENFRNSKPLSSHNVLSSSSPIPTSICVGVLIPSVSIFLKLPIAASLGTSHPGDSEKSSLNRLDFPDGMGCDEELMRASSTDCKTPVPCHGQLASQMSLIDTVQQGEESPQNILHLTDLENDTWRDKEVVKDAAVRRKELTLPGIDGTDFVHDSFLSALGLTQEKIILRKERIQHFFWDKRQRDDDALHCHSNVPLSQPQSPQTLDAVSMEGFDAMSLDSETNDGMRFLLDTEVLNSGESETKETAEDASLISEGPEPQQIFLVKLFNVTCVSQLREENVSVTLEALDVDCVSSPIIKEDRMETTHSSSSPPSLNLKFDFGPCSTHCNGFLQLQIQGFKSELLVSSLTHLGPFLEDEQLSKVLPMKIHITRSSIILKDDGPQLYFSPLLPQPITLTIQDLQVQRKEDGIFYITGDCERDDTILTNEESVESQSKKE
uniref:Bridge-like lipid transfer protein family member 3A n=1 Tax=Leptobrachium leishanense TaxID=445787 RepID=A0A8C5LUV2_9ANUR